jgi:hypothetical protein
VFIEQRQMTSLAAEGTGIESYLENLGIEWPAAIEWMVNYTKGNMERQRPDWDDEDVVFIASLMSRCLTMGVILGRETKA